ncbi:hypothetical protein [Robertkochia solimangrovi]|uniref:hypothetical protein n=1 Tax=Robertkochia solimangrovi TaxID=2213046 RepID=UPI00117DD7DF|nr:hypothetical protein [Robertkochia solimangrovi]TRZ42569.1 hypothetical protein DMZ48_13795 [Robertkochia solimangrovi]
MANKPKKCIPIADAEKLQKNYINTIGKLLKQEYGHDEVQDFSWTAGDLEDYIAWLKEKTGIEDPSKLGLRFYLGKYDKEDNTQTTLFVAPFKVDETTGENVNLLKAEGVDEEVEPLNDAGQGWPPTIYP